MSQDVSGIISWLRQWFDDIYADSSHNHDSRYYTESEMDTALNQKQNTLISGTTIKTINGQSLLDRGNIQISGGSFDFAEIPQGDDLDDYNWQGAFYCTVPYSTISNTPITSPFVLTVDGDVNVLQTFVDLTNKDIYTRVCFNSTFSAWKKQATSDDLLDKTYPIGSIYMSVNSTSPSTLFGGTWVQLQDTFLYATSTTADTGTTAPSGQGEASVTLTANQSGVPAHGHGMAHNHNHRHAMSRRDVYAGSGSAAGAIAYSTSFSLTANSNYDNTASSKSTTDNNTAQNASQAHNNMPPYMKVYMWKRTA